MAIVLEEQFESRTGDVSKDGYKEKRVYHVKGEADPTEVLEQLKPGIGAAHPIFPDTFVSGISIKPLEALELLEVTYDYAAITGGGGNNKPEQRNENNEVWSFEMTAQSRQINSVERAEIPDPYTGESYQTYSYFDKTGAFQSPGIADMTQIGYSDGDPVGIDVYRPYGALRVNKQFDIAEVDFNMRRTLYLMQNTVNIAPWLDNEFYEQEVLFLGANIQYDYASQFASVDYSFLFGMQKNLSFDVIPLGAAADDPLKRIGVKSYPFDHVWLRFPKSDQKELVKNNPVAGTVVRRYPTHVYHARLYPQSDFSQLGLIGP